jgi:hypothetical protein
MEGHSRLRGHRPRYRFRLLNAGPSRVYHVIDFARIAREFGNPARLILENAS